MAFTSQLVVNGSASPGDIRRAFGVPKIAVQPAVDRYRPPKNSPPYEPTLANGEKLTLPL